MRKDLGEDVKNTAPYRELQDQLEDGLRIEQTAIERLSRDVRKMLRAVKDSEQY